MNNINIKDHIITIADFPKKGILFYDTCSLLMHPEAWQKDNCFFDKCIFLCIAK